MAYERRKSATLISTVLYVVSILFAGTPGYAQTRGPTASSAAARAAYSAGLAANAKGDFSAARNQWTTSCEGGVASACFFLAGIYYQGRGTPKAHTIAAYFHAKSCELGDADGCHNVGRQYYTGDGVAQNTGQAIVYYQRAIAINPKHDAARASLSLATLKLARPATSAVPKTSRQAYDQGKAAHERKDYADARRLYTIACNGNDANGCFELGYTYEVGEGAAPDKARAAQLYDRACTLHDAYSCNNLGVMFHTGTGVAQSYDKALATYRRALTIDPENEPALENIALSEQRQAMSRIRLFPAAPATQKAYDAGLAAYRANDYATAERHFGIACDGRLAIGCQGLGVVISGWKGVQQDKSRAVKYFAAACTGGNADGCYNLGLLYDDGTGVTRNLATAFSYYAKACDAGKAGGCYNTGVAYDRGDGVLPSTDRAMNYYRRALVVDPQLAAATKALEGAKRRRSANP